MFSSLKFPQLFLSLRKKGSTRNDAICDKICGVISSLRERSPLLFLFIQVVVGKTHTGLLHSEGKNTSEEKERSQDEERHSRVSHGRYQVFQK
ncbi:hypothetical protein TNIN_499111 [Trichonephila inaurata madagascariensis]|uniref:Uncharacterized protein n=1 Tax=Trichonephila inaurata madagascariensis TaxID=2747483 RepID=A0A8X7BNY2_9ARAC|nr:hypothetical protein TNIN_499111 [Trichonephila inaurata madagascariensis]